MIISGLNHKKYMTIEEGADQTAEINDEEIGFDDLPGDEDIEDVPEEGKEEKPKEGIEEGLSDAEKKLSSTQKKIERAQKRYDKITGQINDARKSKKDDGQPLSAEEKKEREAKKYIQDQAREVLKEEKAEEKKRQAEIEAQLSEELDDVLDENPDFTEDQILDTIEKYAKEFKVALKPNQAAGILKEATKTGKKVEKPKLPRAKSAGTKIESAKKADDGKPDNRHLSAKLSDAGKEMLKAMKNS